MRAVALLAAASALALVTSSAGAPPALKQKQAEAQRVLAEVDALDVQLGRAVEAWNGARYELGKLQVQERRNAAALAAARRQYRIAQQHAEHRLVELYESNEPSTTDAVFGATNVSDVLDRLELVSATVSLDRQIAQTVARTRDTLARKGAELAAERRKQAATVTFLAQRRSAIQTGLARRRTLLASVQGEVRRLQAQERARQARLAAEARARLEAEQRQLALERRQAAQAAAERARRAATTKPQPAATAPAAPTTSDPPTSTTPAITPPSDPGSLGSGHPQAASIALQYLGIPYQWGGASPADGFDCSGLVMYVFAQIGISLPHFAAAQYGYGVAVPRDQLQPGDLVFFDNLNHVGISLGGDQFVEAPHTGDVVKISTITGWYADNYVGARRL